MTRSGIMVTSVCITSNGIYTQVTGALVENLHTDKITWSDAM